MKFNYIAKTKDGSIQSGAIEAPTEAAAISILQTRGFIILSLSAARQGPIFVRQIKIFQRVRQKELVSFARQFATLSAAQVPLLQSLQALVKQTPNQHFREILSEISGEVEGGTLLSRAFSKHPKVFSNFFVNMIKSGEVSGNLENTLNYLADYLEKQYYLTSRIRGALIYPAFILGSFIFIGILMLILVVPKLMQFLKETGQELPLATRLIIWLSDFMQAWWWVAAILAIGAAVFGRYAFKKYPVVREWRDGLILKMPLLGERVFQKMFVTRLAENLSTLIQGGVSILQALQVTAEVVGNAVYRKIIIQAREDVRVGGSLSAALAKHKEIPPLVTQMMATGEQTGALDLVLKKLALFFGKEIDATVDNLSQLIEPILILMIGGAIAFLISAILGPIYSLTSSGAI